MGHSSQAKQKEPHAVLDLGVREENESEVKTFAAYSCMEMMFASPWSLGLEPGFEMHANLATLTLCLYKKQNSSLKELAASHCFSRYYFTLQECLFFFPPFSKIQINLNCQESGVTE